MRQRKAALFGGGILAMTALVALAGGQATVKVVDGVTVVTNGKRPAPPPGTAAKLVLEEIYAIAGGSPGPDFSDISALAVRPDGTVFILDAKESRVSAFDGKGKFLFSFGKKGQGPGEMNFPAGISFSPENELILEDAGNRRLAYFDLKGTFLRHLSTGAALGLSGILMDSQGRIVARSMGLGEGGKIVLEAKTYDKALQPKKSLATVDFGNPLQKKINPFSAMSLLYALDSRGNILLGTSKSYQIRIVDFDAKPIKTIEKDYDPIPVKKEDMDEYMGMVQANAGGVNIKDMIAWPEAFPPYGNFIAGDDGRLFVRTFEKGKVKKEFTWDIFDAEGRYISRILLKTEVQMLRDGKLYGIEEDEDGFKIMKCYRTRWEK